MQSEQPILKLYYLDTLGRGEPIRMLLNHAKIPFEDIRSDIHEFEEFKKKIGPKFEFGQVPVIETPDGELFSQSLAIMRLLGKWYGYYPQDPIAAWKVDSLLDGSGDLMEKYWQFAILEFIPDGYTPESAIAERLQEFLGTHLPQYLTVVQDRFKKNGNSKFMVGDTVTLAEFTSAQVAFNYLMNDNNKHGKLMSEVLGRDEFKEIKAYYMNLKDDIFKEYFETHRKTCQHPF
ncbi:hypothetical protein FGO68_gene16617 [Halteria grandinella]|uniref:GST N-terminal domain-containing protein n=1 Tax=Halteria grandinella TaxID=5974 RepID=A0A8J8SZA2_HALGN|nr:hypothetical protein FGO68_gene16617 [Halteria grandinella]